MGFTVGLRALGVAALVAVSMLAVAPSGAAASQTTTTTAVVTTAVAVAPTAARVVAIAEAQRGKRYVLGAVGPSAFDCAGLVRYAYRRAGVSGRISGQSGYAMLAWARAHHKFSRSNPRVGDVVIYGNGAHVAIYIGKGRVISALNPRQGIRITGLHALRNRVTGFIHTGLSGVRVKLPTTAAKQRGAVVTTSTATVRTLGYTNVRSGPSTSTRVVGVVAPGTALRLTGTTRTSGVRWDRVVYRGHVAWVRADLVRRT